MTTYNLTPTIVLSPAIAERRAARKKVIERARQIERKSYLAFMQKKRRLQVSSDLL